MATELMKWCDLHFPLQRHEAHEVVIGIGGKWYQAHLAENCEMDLMQQPFADVLEFFMDKGVVLKETPRTNSPTQRIGTRTPRTEGDLPCLWCPETFAQAVNLNAHLKQEHEFKSPEEAWGSTCPECNREDFERLTLHVSQTHKTHVSQLFGQLKNKPVAKARKAALVTS